MEQSERKWTLRPSSIIRRKEDGTLWTAGHPGTPAFLGWWFWRLKKARIGWWIIPGDTWVFTDWPPADGAEIVKS